MARERLPPRVPREWRPGAVVHFADISVEARRPSVDRLSFGPPNGARGSGAGTYGPPHGPRPGAGPFRSFRRPSTNGGNPLHVSWRSCLILSPGGASQRPFSGILAPRKARIFSQANLVKLGSCLPPAGPDPFRGHVLGLWRPSDSRVMLDPGSMRIRP